MKKNFLKKGTSITLAIVLMCSLFMGINLNVSAETSYNTGYEAPEVEYIELTEEEYESIVAKEQESSNEVQPNFTLRSFSLNKFATNYWNQFSKPYYSYEFDGIKMSDEKKDLYDRAYSTLYGMIDGGNDCVEDGGYTYTPFVDCGNLSEQDIKDIVTLIQSNHPEIYFISSRYQIGTVSSNKGTTRKIRFEVYEDFALGASRTEASNRIKDKIEWYVSNIDSNGSAYDKEKQIHDLICDNVTYDLNAPYNQSSASVFLNDNGGSVCAGYSEAFCLLCKRCEIPTVSITSSNHEWNLVNLGQYWYAVDVTWADQTNYIYYGYFNKSDKTFTTGDSYVVTGHTPTVEWTNVGRAKCLYDYGEEPSATYCEENGHDWGEVTYTWSDDNKTCTATHVCKTDPSHVETETVNATSQVVTPATFSSKGTTEYKAIFTKSAFTSQTKQVQDISMLTHTYSNPTFEWSADGSSCTVTYTCDGRNCGTGNAHTETYKCTVTKSVLTPATCTEKGVTRYTAVAPYGGFKSYKNVADIPMVAHSTVTKTTPATAKADGKVAHVCKTCGTTVKTTKINKIASNTLNVAKVTFTGNVAKPTVKVLDSAGKVINPKYYTVTTTNKAVGPATAKIVFKTLYKGTLTKAFTIVPKNTAISAATSPKKGSLKAKWIMLDTKNLKQMTGYMIQVSTDPKFKKNVKTAVVKKPTITTNTIKGLKKGKYYVRIRTYRTVKKTNYFSNWKNFNKAVLVK